MPVILTFSLDPVIEWQLVELAYSFSVFDSLLSLLEVLLVTTLKHLVDESVQSVVKVETLTLIVQRYR